MPTKKELEEQIRLLEAENLKQHVMPEEQKQAVKDKLDELIEDLDNNKVSCITLAWLTYEPNLPKLTPGLYKRFWVAQKFNDLYGLTARLLREIDKTLFTRDDDINKT